MSIEKIINELRAQKKALEADLKKVEAALLALNSGTYTHTSLSRNTNELRVAQRKVGDRFIDVIRKILENSGKPLTSRVLHDQYCLIRRQDFEMKNFSSRLSMERKKGLLDFKKENGEHLWFLPEATKKMNSDM